MNVRDLQNRLKRAGRTQTELAAHLGLTHGQISRLLNGKNRLRVDTLQRIEAFLAEAERSPGARGVAENARTPFTHKPAIARFITLEEARALKANPAPKLPLEERQRLIRELGELSQAYKLLPRASAMTDDEILGYDAFGIPSR